MRALSDGAMSQRWRHEGAAVVLSCADRCVVRGWGNRPDFMDKIPAMLPGALVTEGDDGGGII